MKRPQGGRRRKKWRVASERERYDLMRWLVAALEAHHEGEECARRTGAAEPTPHSEANRERLRAALVFLAETR
jgi:hypothetical protein